MHLRVCLVAASLLLSVPAIAQMPSLGTGGCAHDAAPSVRIAACTEVIDGGGLTPEQLVWGLTFRATGYEATGQFERALADWDRAIDIAPNDAASRYNRGNTYLAMKQHEQAIGNYSDALAIAPQLGPAWMNRGHVHAELKRFDRAIADYDQALRLMPDDPRVLNGRARAFFELKRYDTALEDFNRSIRVRPNHPDAWHERGNVYDAQAKHEPALADFDQAIRLEPGSATFRSSSCRTRGAWTADMQRAIVDCDAAVEGQPDNPYYRISRGLVLLKMGTNQRAVADFSITLSQQPGNAMALYGRGIGRLRLGDQGGREDLRQALSIFPQMDKAFERFGVKE